MHVFPLLAAALLSADPAAPPPGGGAVRVDGAAMMWSEWDFETVGTSLDRAVADESRRVMFVVSAHAILERTDDPNAYRLKEIGMIEADDAGGRFAPLAGAVRGKWVDLLTAAFRAAADRGLAVSVLPHLDAHGELQAWRNQYDFDPRATVGAGAAACSYQSAVIDACAEALHAAVPTGEVGGEPIEFALAGEMGRTVFAHPDAYTAMLEGLRADRRNANWEIGLSFNHGGVAGYIPEEDIDRDAVNRLLGACDYVGISHDRPVSVPAVPADFARGMRSFADEFAALGTPLPGGTPLHVSEVGFGGGGRGPDGTVSVPAVRVEDAADAPYLGTKLLGENPLADSRPDLVAAHRAYWAALRGYLSGDADGDLAGLPRATRAHIWSMGSWDPLGWRDPDFRDGTIAAETAAYNAAAE